MPALFNRKAKLSESTPPDNWQEERAALVDNQQWLTESIRDLETQITEQGWLQVGFDGQLEFSRSTLQTLINRARVMAIKNPLIRAAVQIDKNYVFGQGCAVDAVDEDLQQVIDDFWDDKGNQDALTGHVAQTLNEVGLQTDGNQIFAIFSDKLAGVVRVRSIIIDEITDILCNPNDSSEPWFYKREWTEESIDPGNGVKRQRHLVAFYAHLDLPNNPPATVRNTWGLSWPEAIGGHPVFLDPQIYHVKDGHLKHMKFGIPTVYSAMDWATAYKSFLEDEATIWKSLSVFAWKRVGGKTREALTKFKERLNTTRRSGMGETNPAPTTGAIAAMAGNSDLAPIAKSGATIAPEDGRIIRLMVSSGVGIPDTMLSGDPQQGALATAKTLDRPTELGFRSGQKIWESAYKDIAAHVIEVAVEAGVVKGTIETNAYGSRRVQLGSNEDGEERDTTVNVVFPSILEHDVKEQVDSIVASAPYLPKEVVAERLMTALGVDDVAAKLEDLAAEQADAGPDDQQTEAFRNVIEAARALKESVKGGGGMSGLIIEHEWCGDCGTPPDGL